MKKSVIISIIIPCLNEKRTILRAIKRARLAGKLSKLTFEVIVSDSGSTDGTIAVLNKQKLAKFVNAPIKGYGAALHWGILNSKGVYVFFADADLSYDFLQLKKFLKYIDLEYDLILGTRLKGKIQKGSMPLLNRYLGTPALTLLIRLMYGLNVTDCNSGMRLIKRSFYSKLHMRNSGMEWASELLLKTALWQGKYIETPISFYKDRRSRKSHLVPWSDGWRHLKAIVLVKPLYLLFPIILLGLLSILTVKYFFTVSFFFFLLAVTLFLSMLAAMMLNYVIDDKETWLIKRLKKFPLVYYSVVSTICVFAFLFLFPEERIGTKIILISLTMIYNIWVFFIETIRTHLINSLPETK